MFVIEEVSAEYLPDAIAHVGGTKAAASLCCVPESMVKRWCQSLEAPKWARRLLWLGGPWGRTNCAADVLQELRYVAQERDALQREVARLNERLTQESRNAATLVRSLQESNAQLHRLLGSDELVRALSPTVTQLQLVIESLVQRHARSSSANL